MWWLWEVYLRYEQYFITNCPSYRPDPWSRLMLLVSLSPLGLWLLSLWCAWWDRSLFHKAHVFGQVLNSITLYVLAQLLPAFRSTDNPANDCASRLLSRPAEEVAAMFFALFFNAFHDLRVFSSQESVSRPLTRLGTMVALVTTTVLLCYAQTYLHLFEAKQVLLALVGSILAGGVFTVVHYQLIVPLLDNAYIHKILLYFCCVRKDSLQPGAYFRG